MGSGAGATVGEGRVWSPKGRAGRVRVFATLAAVVLVAGSAGGARSMSSKAVRPIPPAAGQRLPAVDAVADSRGSRTWEPPAAEVLDAFAGLRAMRPDIPVLMPGELPAPVNLISWSASSDPRVGGRVSLRAGGALLVFYEGMVDDFGALPGECWSRPEGAVGEIHRLFGGELAVWREGASPTPCTAGDSPARNC